MELDGVDCALKAMGFTRYDMIEVYINKRYLYDADYLCVSDICTYVAHSNRGVATMKVVRIASRAYPGRAQLSTTTAYGPSGLRLTRAGQQRT